MFSWTKPALNAIDSQYDIYFFYIRNVILYYNL